ncbi:hypothetical protein DDZ16_12510 [Marinilabilia rubra]|uniref:Uncharacterized protein n=1 Tax=Marinilabilia rubra TaxID=2162893 RepID=A0A2U2B7Q5_9BACT|nr:hypothetical protein DDZ16_12510 [Marinilabilia rubra]
MHSIDNLNSNLRSFFDELELEGDLVLLSMFIAKKLEKKTFTSCSEKGLLFESNTPLNFCKRLSNSFWGYVWLLLSSVY